MRNYILVAGVNYETAAKGRAGTNFYVFCNKRHKKLYLQDKGTEDLNFYMIDIAKGKINLVEYKYDVASAVYAKKESVHKTFDPVTSGNYFDFNSDGHIRFHPNKKNIISKYDIYDLIETIGVANPGTLIEFSIYSHAYFDGPILVNSSRSTGVYIDPIDNVTEIDVPVLGKDPNDYDMRQWDLNFYLQQPIRAQKLVDMKLAFEADGIIRIWGCNFPKYTLHPFLVKVRSHKSYKKTGLLNTDNFVFGPGRLNSKIRVFLESYLGYIRMVTTPLKFTSADTITITFLEIKKIYCISIEGSYARDISRLFNRQVISGLPATYSIYSPSPRISPDTVFHLPFYTTYLGFKLDPEGFNYGIYEPDYDCNDYY
jgi:hypothetical protein